MGIKVTENKKPKLTGRDLAERKREEKLIEIRQKRLDKKNKKAKPSGLSMTPSIIKKTKPKLTGLAKVEAEREAKLVERRKKYLAKKAKNKK